ncbi:hypothetical protein AQUSIP_02850 [Aquicella siphonis]|uniref:Helix-turn-helix domain-containing protein n=1 Tax=Aquicella siphonis TaxID=254247 RepID=A0A5E4PF78_9COXI|nr:helix-turn-helix domain-containing protein [Aquicella siphonis]VVC75011.1 hypothetical protein AQUSIP_02850 [Aquicella siphonis]
MIIRSTNVEAIQIIMFPDGRLDTRNAALYLGLKEKTLAMMRGSGTGPKFIKRGRVFYFKEDLDAWINAEGRLISTAQSFHK